MFSALKNILLSFLLMMTAAPLPAAAAAISARKEARLPLAIPSVKEFKQQKKGGFENHENIKYFLAFAQRIFAEYAPTVTLWTTLNEPGVYTTQSFIRGVFPPGKQNAELAGIVMCNLMRAHVATYRMLKAMPHGDRAQIGIVHQFLKTETTPAAAFLMGSLANYFNACFHNAVFNFLKTGIFDFEVESPSILNPIKWAARIPESAHVYCDNLVNSGEKFLDWLGVNYYAHSLLGMTGPTCAEGEYMTDMPYRAYPQGLYEVIHEASQLDVPLYITENGISDVKDLHREEWIRTYLYAVHCALADGCDVRGFYYWSFMDNFEWDMGTQQHFGLYEVDFATKRRTLRKGSKAYNRIIAHHRSTAPHAGAAAGAPAHSASEA